MGSHWKSFAVVRHPETPGGRDGASHKPKIGIPQTFVKSVF
jgi:hypothetical protein